jgi:pimeloyl-ACP methyl ester carboxylesterase
MIVEKKVLVTFIYTLIMMGFKEIGDKDLIPAKQTVQQEAETSCGYVPVNGIRMYYEIYGNGKPLVLIHGGGSTIQTTFSKIIPELSKANRVIAVELQGHGHTSDRNSPESFEQDADDVVGLLSNLNISRASFLGFSNGGNTAIQIAISHPEIVNKLILASTFYKRDGLQDGFFEGMKQATINDMPQSLRSAFLEINPDSSRLKTMFEKDKKRMLQFHDWSEEAICSIKAPTLIICGDRDVVKSEHAVAISKLIYDSRLMILPATHGSYIGVAESQGPDKKLVGMTLKIIEDFL